MERKPEVELCQEVENDGILQRASTTKNENFTIDLSFPTMKFAKKTDADPSFVLAVTAPDVPADPRLRNDL